jgi:hypothetical protein
LSVPGVFFQSAHSEQSNHPHIKNGEVYVTHLSNVSIDNNVVDAIGILKVKFKPTLQFEEKFHLEMILQHV